LGFSPFVLPGFSFVLVSTPRILEGNIVFVQLQTWGSIAVEILILVRAIKGGFIRKYSIFYFYLSSVLLMEALRFAVKTFLNSSYPAFYWYTDYVLALLGFAVIFEIYKDAFEKFPGAVRASYVLLVLILMAVLWKAAGDLVAPRLTTFAMLERDTRAVQGLLLLVIIGLLVHYAIPVGRNFIGIVLGYGLFIAIDATSLAIGAQLRYNPSLGWRIVPPLVYIFVLLVWCTTLWSYRPNPELEPDSMLEHDYRLIAQRTKGVLSKAFSYLKLGGAE
jgi:hypothetical protein